MFWKVMLILLLALPVYGQERMKSSEGWHQDGKLWHDLSKSMPGIYAFDTSRVFIERLDTVKADTCLTCPDGYELWVANDRKDSVCLGRVKGQSGWWREKKVKNQPPDLTAGEFNRGE